MGNDSLSPSLPDSEHSVAVRYDSEVESTEPKPLGIAIATIRERGGTSSTLDEISLVLHRSATEMIGGLESKKKQPSEVSNTPNTETVTTFDQNPHTHLENIYQLYKNLSNSVSIRSKLSLLSSIDYEHGVRSVLSHHPTMGVYAGILLESIDTTTIDFLGEITDIQTAKNIIRDCASELKEEITNLHPELYYGPHWAHPEDVDEVFRALYKITLQSGNKTSRLSVAVEQLSRKKAELLKTNAGFKKILPLSTRTQTPEALITKSSTEYLLLPPKRKEGIPLTSPWIDKEREDAFGIIQNTFIDLYNKSLDRQEFKTWFVNELNAAFQLTNDNALTIGDLSSLEMVIWQSAEISEVAGVEIQRPVFIFRESKQYSDFIKKLYGEGRDGFHAISFNFSANIESRLAKAGLIFSSTEDTELLEHEIMHSLDSTTLKRNGYDRLVSELIGYYRSCINSPTLFKAVLELYFDEFSRTADRKMDYDDYVRLVSESVDRTVRQHQRDGQTATLRKLIQCKSIENLP